MNYGIIGVTCPNCNYEFKDDIDAIKYRIMEINENILDIDAQLGILRNAPKEEQEARKQWKINVFTKKKYLRKELIELKAKFDKLHEKRDIRKFTVFREVVKDFYGEEVYERCLTEMIKRTNEEFLVGE